VERTRKFRTIDGKFESLKKRNFLTIDDFKIKGKVLLLRVDVNSSIDPETGAMVLEAASLSITTRTALRDGEILNLTHKVLMRPSRLFNY